MVALVRDSYLRKQVDENLGLRRQQRDIGQCATSATGEHRGKQDEWLTFEFPNFFGSWLKAEDIVLFACWRVAVGVSGWAEADLSGGSWSASVQADLARLNMKLSSRNGSGKDDRQRCYEP